MTSGVIEGRACRPRRTGTTWECRNWRTQQGEWHCGHCGLPLPPIAIEFDPPAGLVGNGGAPREVKVVFDRLEQSSHDELKQFVIEVTSSASRERRWEIPIAGCEPSTLVATEPTCFVAWSRLTLELAPPAGRPFDLTAALRHRARPGSGEPLAIGHYDYPVPTVDFPGPAVVLLRPQAERVGIPVAVAPESSRIAACAIEVPELELTLAGTAVPNGTTLLLSFALDETARAALESLAASVAAVVRIAFKGVASEVSRNVTLMRAAALELQATAELRGLTGRQARIGAYLRNGGGSAARVERLDWRLSSEAGEAARGEFDELVGLQVPSEGAVVELRPALVDEAGAPLAPGRYGLELDLEYRDEHDDPSVRSTTRSSVSIDVRAEKVYQGLVCIDFGTTDTAAAILPRGKSYFQDPRTGLTPRPLELGPISPMDRSASRHFIPTQVAVGEGMRGEPVMLCAEEAVEGFGRLKRGRLVDRLKWKLGLGLDSGEADDFGSIEDLVTRYLEHVRGLIEEHPEVCARVEKVIATRPARFGKLREQALISAFRRAGMEVDLTPFGVKSRPLVSESWPPVLLMLPIREDPVRPASTRLLAELRAVEPRVDFPEPLDLDALASTPHYLCIFDIGGGSTDVSLLKLTSEGGRIHVSDEWTYTDDHFAGEGIRDLIVDELRTSANLALAGTGKPFREDLQVLRAVAAKLQFYPEGPFNHASSSFFAFAEKFGSLTKEGARCLAGWLREHRSMSAPPSRATLPPGEADAVALLSWLREELQNYVQPSFGYTQQVRLPLGGGRTLLLTGDPLHDLMIRVFLRFVEEFRPRIELIYREVQHHLQGAHSDNLRMLMTGRGSAFALNEPLIAEVAAMVGLEPKGFHRAPGASAKAVTSWGALALYSSRQVAKVLEFAGLVGGYALLASDFFDRRKRVGAVALEPVDIEGETYFGVAFHRIPTDFDHRVLTVGEDLGPRQEADIYVGLDEAGLDLGSLRGTSPAGGLLFSPEQRRVFPVADFSSPRID